MAQASKIIKVNGGDAFIEIGETYIRIGVGSEVFMTFDKNSITGGAKSLDWQMEPNKTSYYGILNHVSGPAGMSPVGPKYQLNLRVLRSLQGLITSMNAVRSAVGMGV